MFACRSLHRRGFNGLSPCLLQSASSSSSCQLQPFSLSIPPSQTLQSDCYRSSPNLRSLIRNASGFGRFPRSKEGRGRDWCNGWRGLSTAASARGRSMRSKVERRMRQEAGKTMREVRRAKKIQKKLMTDEERLIYNLRRAKKKVALLLQKLKKYELPELPLPRHDPELFTPEQLQAYKKIGFRNKNYCPVGVRGVFGGVVQNMHLHWKFHETVQVCCDNFPKEKIKEMATMLARLSGGIVVNIHNVKTIIMFRGRNYRQPKNLIPMNTLTKRKALFKARFEQALESQKLNIKKIEQQLRRMGVNPDDPVAMASIQRVASTFFNAIDRKEGSPYVFHGDKQSLSEPDYSLKPSEPSADSDQEELDRFISEIEDAADKEWAEEEAAEKEEIGKIRYLNRENFSERFIRAEMPNNEDSDGDHGDRRHWKDARGRQRPINSDDGEVVGDRRHRKDARCRQRVTDSDDEDEEDEEDDGISDSEKRWDTDDSDDDTGDKFKVSAMESRRQDINERSHDNRSSREIIEVKLRQKMTKEDSGSEDLLSDLEDPMWKSEAEEERGQRAARAVNYEFKSSSDEEDSHGTARYENNDISLGSDHESDADDSDGRDDSSEINWKNRMGRAANDTDGFKRRNESKFGRNMSVAKDSSSDCENATWESDAEEDSELYRVPGFDYGSGDEDANASLKRDENDTNARRPKTAKQMDEEWDSD